MEFKLLQPAFPHVNIALSVPELGVQTILVVGAENSTLLGHKGGEAGRRVSSVNLGNSVTWAAWTDWGMGRMDHTFMLPRYMPA